MHQKNSDKANVVFPPPLIFGLCLGISFGLEYVWPMRPMSWPWLPRIAVGALFLAAAGFFAVASIVVLIRNNTPFDPARPTLKIVKSGVFRFSRNPMYLSLVLLMVGIAAGVCSLWFWALVPVLWAALDYGAIRPEERYLIDKFGEAYLNYMRDVRRWL